MIELIMVGCGGILLGYFMGEYRSGVNKVIHKLSWEEHQHDLCFMELEDAWEDNEALGEVIEQMASTHPDTFYTVECRRKKRRPREIKLRSRAVGLSPMAAYRIEKALEEAEDD